MSSKDQWDGIGEVEADRNIWIANHDSLFDEIKSLNDCSPDELAEILSKSQGVAVYLCWEVMNSVTLHAVAGSESLALRYSKYIRDVYETRGFNCKIKIERVIVNHFFASTMVDYTIHDPVYAKLRLELDQTRSRSIEEQMILDKAIRVLREST